MVCGLLGGYSETCVHYHTYGESKTVLCMHVFDVERYYEGDREWKSIQCREVFNIKVFNWAGFTVFSPYKASSVHEPLVHTIPTRWRCTYRFITTNSSIPQCRLSTMDGIRFWPCMLAQPIAAPLLPPPPPPPLPCWVLTTQGPQWPPHVPLIEDTDTANLALWGFNEPSSTTI